LRVSQLLALLLLCGFKLGDARVAFSVLSARCVLTPCDLHQQGLSAALRHLEKAHFELCCVLARLPNREAATTAAGAEPAISHAPPPELGASAGGASSSGGDAANGDVDDAVDGAAGGSAAEFSGRACRASRWSGGSLFLAFVDHVVEKNRGATRNVRPPGLSSALPPPGAPFASTRSVAVRFLA
jgi:hypothetical protein